MKRLQNVCLLLTFTLVTTSLCAQEFIEWAFPTGNKVFASPVIRNDSLFIGSNDGNFYAINAATGDELWHFATGNQVRSTAALYQDIICFESGNVLYGLGLNGLKLWTDTLYDGAVINEHDEWDCFRSSPTLQDSIAYIGSEEGTVIGVNVKTGERVFEARTALHNTTIETTPAIYNGMLFVGDWLGVFTAFNLETQEIVWDYDTKTDNTYSWVNAIHSKALIYNDIVYFGGRSCNLYAMDPETGDRIWMYHQPGSMWLFGGPVEYDGVLYVGSSYQQVIYAFSPDAPELLWSGNVAGLNYGDPLVTNEYVIVGTGSFSTHNEGSLTVVDKLTHEIAGRFNVGGWVTNTPITENGNIYFGGNDGNIYSVNLQELINVPYPELNVQEGTLDFGLQTERITLDTTFVVFNTGQVEDSVSITASKTGVTFSPAEFILPASDTQVVTLALDLSMVDEGNRSITYFIQSYNTMLNTRIVRAVKYNLQPPLALVEDDGISEHRVYPNPADEEAYAEFNLSTDSYVCLQVFNQQGALTTVGVNEFLQAGNNSVRFSTSGLPEGIYFCRLSANDQINSFKLLITRY